MDDAIRIFLHDLVTRASVLRSIADRLRSDGGAKRSRPDLSSLNLDISRLADTVSEDLQVLVELHEEPFKQADFVEQVVTRAIMRLQREHRGPRLLLERSSKRMPEVLLRPHLSAFVLSRLLRSMGGTSGGKVLINAADHADECTFQLTVLRVAQSPSGRIQLPDERFTAKTGLRIMAVDALSNAIHLTARKAE